MVNKTNFLIGRGERLTAPVTVSSGFSKEVPVYSLNEAKKRLLNQINATSEKIAGMEEKLCPGGLAVAKVQLNPSYIARSYFPEKLLRHIGMQSIGSKTVSVKPEKWKRKIPVETTDTTQLFIAGLRSNFEQLPNKIENLINDSDEAIQFARVEAVSTFKPEEKVINLNESNNGSSYFEMCLHLGGNHEINQQIIVSLEIYAKEIGVKIYDEFQFLTGNLWFVPIYGDLDQVNRLSQFSMVRLVRHMPKLRGITPLLRETNIKLNCQLPDIDAKSKDISVAILDGGIPEKNPVNRWLDSYIKLKPNAIDDEDANAHGLGVTSAFLFGPIKPDTEAEQPYSKVTNIRLLDGDTSEENFLELYQTLSHIEEILESKKFEYINLSLGPELPVEDNEVHAWTSVIDTHLSDGQTFMAVAAGNNGNLDWASGNARIQIPSDCINATSVGSSDKTSDDWSRAKYSAIGPGRRPGVVKPDMLAFGGSPNEYFHVLDASDQPAIIPNMGTSFASPYLLRKAVGIRAILGKDISPLVSKALLVHSSLQSVSNSFQEVGWGRIPEDLNDIITSPDGVARIVYQGELNPGKFLRAKIPLPNYELQGKINLKATLCYTCDTDPQDSGAYSKAGLEITFRPHKGKTKRNKKGEDVPKTKSFFSQLKYQTEQELRKHSLKWETTLHASHSMYGRSVSNPVFDIHHIARDAAGEPSKPRKIRYAFIVSVEAKKHTSLYNDILDNYARVLTPIEPQVEIQIET